ncbi:MAG: IdeS/Mac family cysteine endopeptidase [Opitutales bacterium]|nr:IdeS/Mac family cysteine endopeptidase [Opitutales bacterium]
MFLRSRPCVFLTFLTASLACAPWVQSETVWAKGVSKSRGWTDADKGWDNDKFLCWAASAANIIEWWQKRNAGTPLPEGAPRKAEDILKLFSKTFVDVGRGSDIAWRWYFGGCDLVDVCYMRDFRDAETARTSGRFWEDYVVEKCGWANPRDGEVKYVSGGFATDVSAGERRADALAETLAKLLSEGKGVTISLSSGGKFPQGHAITLWGIEYEKNRIKSVYVTDSDDRVRALKKYDVAYVTTEETGGDGKEDGTPFFKWEKTTIYLLKYHGSNGYAIQSWAALDLPCVSGKAPADTKTTHPVNPKKKVFRKDNKRKGPPEASSESAKD